MLEISNLSLPLDAGLPGNEYLIARAAAKACGVKTGVVKDCVITKISVDARKKQDVHFVASVRADLGAGQENRVLAQGARVKGVNIKPYQPYEPLEIPACSCADDERPVVVGLGPAGLFAALYLARAGLRPIVLERGGAMEDRLRSVEEFNAGGDLDPRSNIQFGEGGAGTFSDGKLTTNIKNPLTKHVLHWLVDAGAPEEILVKARPHIGTDLLRDVVTTMREQIIAAGGEVHFDTQLVDVVLDGAGADGASNAMSDPGAVRQVVTRNVRTGEECTIKTSHVILACGHSARDTFGMVHELGATMEQKPFSLGVRIEHSQDAINRAQYGRAADHPALGAADYKLSVHLPSGRGVYTFCMCPGGEVVCAASESGGVVVNGMSQHARAGANANSAVLVGVDPSDFPGEHPLAGVELQRTVEQAAYDLAVRAGGKPYQAPAQHVGDFLRADKDESDSAPQPSYARGVVWCDLHECLPDYVSASLEEALPLLDKRLHGFADPAAIMTGVETRSSSPVRIVRDEQLQSNIRGLYPCGEGAGYAGGIMSAACDGLRVAMQVAADCKD